MVNTFLTQRSFRASAKSLDSRRLGKQRVEALQILNLLEDVTFLCSYFKLPCPTYTKTSPPDRLLWSNLIKKIKSRYRSLSFRFVRLKPTEKSSKYQEIIEKFNITSTNYSTIDIEQIEKMSRISDSPIRIVKLGFVNHPIVRMWFGFSNSLKAYINAHLEEWISRGYKNHIPSYSIPKEYSRPSWTLDKKFHRNHRAALLEKEISRKERAWYCKKEKFTSAGTFSGYIWY